MAKRGSDSTTRGPAPAPAQTPPDFAQVLGIADALPMPIAYIDRERRYRFVNRAFAEFFERPRSAILGQSVRELLGEALYKVRQPMFDAAFAGERQYFVADF